MPWNRALYPPDWEMIRTAILIRADDRCEGSPFTPDCRIKNHIMRPETGTLVVLTIAHLCRCTPKCGELSHLRALCQRCHLALDLDDHLRHAAENRRKTKEALGQLSFLA